MSHAKTRSLLTVLAVVGALTVPASAAAAPPSPGPDIDDVFPAGIACADFDLRVTGGGGKRQLHTFVDKNGNVVRLLETGTGSALVHERGNRRVRLLQVERLGRQDHAQR